MKKTVLFISILSALVSLNVSAHTDERYHQHADAKRNVVVTNNYYNDNEAYPSQQQIEREQHDGYRHHMMHKFHHRMREQAEYQRRYNDEYAPRPVYQQRVHYSPNSYNNGYNGYNNGYTSVSVEYKASKPLHHYHFSDSNSNYR
jgi:hypothetical protein